MYAQTVILKDLLRSGAGVAPRSLPVERLVSDVGLVPCLFRVYGEFWSSQSKSQFESSDVGESLWWSTCRSTLVCPVNVEIFHLHAQC